MKALLNRLDQNEKQTLGYLTVHDDVVKIFDCYTIELPDKNNQVGVSRIPAGTYECEQIQSPSQGLCFSVKDVPGRSHILIHVGNYHYDFRGCIGVGSGLGDINGDGYRDVGSSRPTLNRMLKLIDTFTLTII